MTDLNEMAHLVELERERVRIVFRYYVKYDEIAVLATSITKNNMDSLTPGAGGGGVACYVTPDLTCERD